MPTIYLRRAISINPADAAFHSNLAEVHRVSGRFAEAADCCRAALALQPNHAGALNNLGLALFGQGRMSEALPVYKRALELEPTLVEAHNNLGTILKQLDRPQEAVASYREAIRLRPNFAEAHNNLGGILKELGDAREARERHYEEAIRLKPDFPEPFYNLGNILSEQGKLTEAIACYQGALRLKPILHEAHNNLAGAYKNMGALDAALASYREAIRIKPDFAQAYFNIGVIYDEQNQLEEARVHYLEAVRLSPDLAEAHNNLGSLYLKLGRADWARDSFVAGVKFKPQHVGFASNILLCEQYLPDMTLAKMVRTHGAWAKTYAEPLRSTWPVHHRDRDPDRRLRLGFVSADLGFHPVGCFFLPLLENLDREKYETFLYAAKKNPDFQAERLSRAADQWRQIHELVRSRPGGIDRARRNRYSLRPVGPYGPSPLADVCPQAGSGAGELDRLRRHDGLFGNRLPAGRPATRFRPRASRTTRRKCCGCLTPGFASSRRWMLLKSVRCRRPERLDHLRQLQLPGKSDAPSRGSLGRHPQAGSRFPADACSIAASMPSWHASRFRELFTACGIEERRVHLLGTHPHTDVMRRYHEVDIALDPFPYSGGLTTCEALWMGVPVVTCPGETFASRHSLSLMSNIGITETIAANLDDYVRIAVELAGDLPRLTDIAQPAAWADGAFALVRCAAFSASFRGTLPHDVRTPGAKGRQRPRRWNRRSRTIREVLEQNLECSSSPLRSVCDWASERSHLSRGAVGGPAGFEVLVVVGVGPAHCSQPVLETSFRTAFQRLDIRDGDLGVSPPGIKHRHRAVGWVPPNEPLLNAPRRAGISMLSSASRPEALLIHGLFTIPFRSG